MIESSFFLTVFLLLPAIWSCMLRVAGVELLRVSIPGILMLAIYIFQYLGFPVLFFELNESRARSINDRAVLWEVFGWSSITITLLIIGFIFSRKAFGPLHKKTIYNSFGNLPKPASSRELGVMWIVFFVGALALIDYISTIGFSNIAFVGALNILHQDVSINMLRSQMGNDFEGNYHWYALLMRDFLQIAVLAMFAHFLLCKRATTLIYFLMGFLVVAFSMLMSAEKAPVLWFLISMGFVYAIVQQRGHLSIKMILAGCSVLLVVIGVMYVYFMSSADLLAGIGHGLSRASMGEMSGLYHYLQIFPGKVDYLLGTSFPNPGGLLPWEPYRLTVEVMYIVKPDLYDQGVVGSMPTFFWGEMYANFGYLGILVPPFFVGATAYAVNTILFRLPMSPFVIAVFVWFVLHIKRLTVTGLSAFIINTNGIAVVILLLSGLFVAGAGVIRYRRKRVRELRLDSNSNEIKSPS